MKYYLNNSLYNQLVSYFGAVEVANAGIPANLIFKKDLEGNTVIDEVSSSWGEYYRVNCTKCGDTRKRLWVNHTWGTKLPHNNNRLRHNVICYNENCDWSDLKDRLKNYYYNQATKDDVIVQVKNPEPVKISAPGVCIPLNQLAVNHQAVNYLDKRGFDIEELCDLYGLSYCIESKVGAQDRIVIPILKDFKVVGWQARYIDQYGSGKPANKHIPKYFTAAGFKAKEHLYNLDYAVNYDFVIVTEGPFDALRIGPPAVAIFGKTLSAKQKNLLWSHWYKGKVILALDGDAYDDMAVMHRELAGMFDGGVYSMKLIDNKNPADLSREMFWYELAANIEVFNGHGH